MMKIAFASCCRYEAFPNIPDEKKQPEWDAIQNLNPDYLLLLGDNIYMDYGLPVFSQDPVQSPKDLSCSEFKLEMAKKYEQQFSVPSFNNLVTTMRERSAFFATWDDHDFAWDNACGDQVPEDKKQVSTRLFKEWVLGEVDDSPIYRYVDLPKENPVARFIILDNRSYSEQIKPQHHESGVVISPSEGKSLLGEEQLQFLLDKMDNHLPHTFVCSGLTLTKGSENWSEYEEEFEIFWRAVDNSNSNIFFVGGDIHKNRIYKPNYKRPCYEIISSGISVNYIGFPSNLDDCHNWGVIEFDSNHVTVTLYKATHNQNDKIKNINEKIFYLI